MKDETLMELRWKVESLTERESAMTENMRVKELQIQKTNEEVGKAKTKNKNVANESTTLSKKLLNSEKYVNDFKIHLLERELIIISLKKNEGRGCQNKVKYNNDYLEKLSAANKELRKSSCSRSK